jgi:ketosteroid isomerase-like protein
MSQRDVEIIRHLYGLTDDVAQQTRDKEALEELAAGLAEFMSPEIKTILNGPRYSKIREEASGLDGFLRLWRDWVRPFHSYRIELDEIIDLDGRVLALTLGRARVEPGGAEIANRGGTICTVADGRVIQVESFIDQEHAREAAYGRT